jgi:hypothetical protein
MLLILLCCPFLLCVGFNLIRKQHHPARTGHHPEPYPHPQVAADQKTQQHTKEGTQAWDIWWSDRGELLKHVPSRLNAFQKVNHFPSMEGICRKDFLAIHL